MNWQNVLRTGGDFGPRFNLVGIVPTTFLAVFVIALSWSGAPGKAPSWSRLLAAARELKAGEAVILFAVILFAALLGQPLQRPLVRLLEGYWAERPRIPAWLAIMARRGQERRYSKLSDLASRDLPGEGTYPAGISGAYCRRVRWRRRADPDRFLRDWRACETRRILAAKPRLRSCFPAAGRILPTALGNALRAAEDSAGQRYGLDSVTLWPALYTVLSPSVREAVDDHRDQLDLGVRLCAVLVGCALAAAVMLWNHPLWMLGFVAATLFAARLAYRAAVVAAVGYGVMIRLAFDRHRFDLLAGLHLPQPPDSTTERETNQRLTSHLIQNTRVLLQYQHPTSDGYPTNPSMTSTWPDAQSGGQAPYLTEQQRLGHGE
jgi:hypothetical protein